MIINCNSTTIDLYEGHVMGVLNVTPDSFYDGGKYKDLNSIVSQAKQMLEDGATFIDIGGASTKPGADVVDEKEEINRVKKETEDYKAAMIRIWRGVAGRFCFTGYG